MLLGRHSLVIGVCSLLLLSGCGYSSSGSSSGSTDAPGSGTGTSGGTSSGGPPSDPLGGGGGITGTNDLVVATPSVGGTVSVAAGATRNVSITFTSNDGSAISGFGVSTGTGALP